MILRAQLNGSVVQPIEGDEHIMRDGYVKPQPIVTPQAVLNSAASRPAEVLKDRVFTAADKAAVEATNNGAMTWRDAHAQWLESTQRELSPPSFGRRIQALGGGKRPKSFVASSISPAVASSTTSGIPAQSPSQLHRTSMPKPPVSASVDANIQQFALPAAGPAPQNSQFLPQVMPPPDAFDAADQDSLKKQRQDITQVQIAMHNLNSVVTNLADQVASLRREGSRLPLTQSVSEDTPVELLMDNLSNVMTKVAGIDSLKMQVDVLQRKIKRLENGSGSTSQGSPAEGLNQQGPSLSTPQPLMATLAGMVVPVSNAQTSLSASPIAWQSGNSLKRALPESMDPEPNAKRQKQDDTIASSPYFPPRSGPLAASQMSSQALAHDFEQGKRPRGRPRKNPVPDFSLSASQTPQPQWTQLAGNPFNDVSPSFAADYVDDRGQVVRRGGGALNAYMSPDGRKGRTRPIRNDEGVLIRKDGKPDRRSMTSAENLRRTMIRKQEEAKELSLESVSDLRRARTVSGKSAPEGSPQLVVLDDDDYSTHSNFDDALATREKRAGPGSPSGTTRKPDQPAAISNASEHANAHSDVMRKMFPQGLSEAARSVDFASQLFRTNSPVATLSENPFARMAVRAEIGTAPAASAMTSNTAIDSPAATASTTLPVAEASSAPAPAPATASAEPSVLSDEEEEEEEEEDEVMHDAPDAEDGSDGDYQELSRDSSANASSLELLISDAAPTPQVQEVAQDVRDVRNADVAAEPAEQPAKARRIPAETQAPPPGMIPTADQGTRVKFTEYSEILGLNFCPIPVTKAIINSQTVSKEALKIMRKIFETSGPSARTHMAVFVKRWEAGDAQKAVAVQDARAAKAAEQKQVEARALLLAVFVNASIAPDISGATINLARQVLADRLLNCTVAKRVTGAQNVPKESFVIMKSIFEKDPMTMDNIPAFFRHLQAEGTNNTPAVQDLSNAEKAGDEALVGADIKALATLATKTHAAIANPGACAGSVTTLKLAREILGNLYVSPVVDRIISSQSLSKESIVLMRSIFEKDPPAMKDMEVFLAHLEPAATEPVQEVRDVPTTKTAAAADPEVLDATAIANAPYKAVRPRALKRSIVTGTAALQVAAREILGEHHNCSIASRYLSIQESFPRESLVKMRAIFDKDPATRKDMGVFLKEFAKKDKITSAREDATMGAEKIAAD